MVRRSFVTALVGPRGLLQEGLIRILNASDFRVVSTSNSIDDLVFRPLEQRRSILLIIDADAGAEVDQITVFKEKYPTSHVVILADHYRLSDIISRSRAGADAYLIKVAASDAFIKSLELVMLGQTVFPPEVLSLIQDQDAYREQRPVLPQAELHLRQPLEAGGAYAPMLSVREKSILRCLIEGEPNKVIARKIKIAEATVKVHVKTILRKIRVQNRTQAAVWAMNNGLIDSVNGQISASTISDLIETEELPEESQV